MSEVDRKVFVGGLTNRCTSQILANYFEKFGSIEDANIILDKETGNSKGYGFVVFYDVSSALNAVVDGSPLIDGKQANCNIAAQGASTSDKRKREIVEPSRTSTHGISKVYDRSWGEKRPRTNLRDKQNYIQRLRQQGTIITKESAIEYLESEKKTDPVGAFKYFLEVSDIFRHSAEFEYYARTLLDMAKHFRRTGGEIKEVEPLAISQKSKSKSRR